METKNLLGPGERIGGPTLNWEEANERRRECSPYERDEHLKHLRKFSTWGKREYEEKERPFAWEEYFVSLEGLIEESDLSSFTLDVGTLPMVTKGRGVRF